jgi:hypothetical protein
MSLPSSIASSLDHSAKSSSSWKYVKLTFESARFRRCMKETTLDGMLSEMGPSKTYFIEIAGQLIPAIAKGHNLNLPRSEPSPHRIPHSRYELISEGSSMVIAERIRYLLRSESRRRLDRRMERSIGPMSGGESGRLPIMRKGLGFSPRSSI